MAFMLQEFGSENPCCAIGCTCAPVLHQVQPLSPGIDLLGNTSESKSVSGLCNFAGDVSQLLVCWLHK